MGPEGTGVTRVRMGVTGRAANASNPAAMPREADAVTLGTSATRCLRARRVWKGSAGAAPGMEDDNDMRVSVVGTGGWKNEGGHCLLLVVVIACATAGVCLTVCVCMCESVFVCQRVPLLNRTQSKPTIVLPTRTRNVPGSSLVRQQLVPPWGLGGTVH